MRIRNSSSQASRLHSLNADSQREETDEICQIKAETPCRSSVVERVASILTEISRNGSRRCRLKDLALAQVLRARRFTVSSTI